MGKRVKKTTDTSEVEGKWNSDRGTQGWTVQWAGKEGHPWGPPWTLANQTNRGNHQAHDKERDAIKGSYGKDNNSPRIYRRGVWRQTRRDCQWGHGHWKPEEQHNLLPTGWGLPVIILDPGNIGNTKDIEKVREIIKAVTRSGGEDKVSNAPDWGKKHLTREGHYWWATRNVKTRKSSQITSKTLKEPNSIT